MRIIPLIKTRLKKITKRRRIIELECTSDEDDVLYSQNFDSAKENKGQYAQRISKIKRNSGQEYCTKNSKIIPEKKFENKNCNCSKKCVERIRAVHRIWGPRASFSLGAHPLYSKKKKACLNFFIILLEYKYN